MWSAGFTIFGDIIHVVWTLHATILWHNIVILLTQTIIYPTKCKQGISTYTSSLVFLVIQSLLLTPSPPSSSSSSIGFSQSGGDSTVTSPGALFSTALSSTTETTSAPTDTVSSGFIVSGSADALFSSSVMSDPVLRPSGLYITSRFVRPIVLSHARKSLDAEPQAHIFK